MPGVQISSLTATFSLLHPAHQLRSIRGVAHDVVLQSERHGVFQVEEGDIGLTHGVPLNLESGVALSRGCTQHVKGAFGIPPTFSYDWYITDLGHFINSRCNVYHEPFYWIWSDVSG